MAVHLVQDRLLIYHHLEQREYSIDHVVHLSTRRGRQKNGMNWSMPIRQCQLELELELLREQDEQALRSDEYLVEEADESEPDDGRDVDAAERRDELAGDGEEGLGGRVRQHVGEVRDGELGVPRHDDPQDEEEAERRERRPRHARHRLGRRRVQVAQHRHLQRRGG